MICRRVNIACSLEDSRGSVDARITACRSDMTVSTRQRYLGNGVNMLGGALKKYFEASALLLLQEKGEQNALFCPVGGAGGGTPVVEAALEQIGSAAAIFVAEETGDIHISWAEKLILAV
jgi:hypothetical protein